MSTVVIISDQYITAIGIINGISKYVDEEIDEDMIAYDGSFVRIVSGSTINDLKSDGEFYERVVFGLPYTIEAPTKDQQAWYHSQTSEVRLNNFIKANVIPFTVDDLTAKMTSQLTEYLILNPGAAERVKEIILDKLIENIGEIRFFDFPRKEEIKKEEVKEEQLTKDQIKTQVRDQSELVAKMIHDWFGEAFSTTRK